MPEALPDDTTTYL